MSGPVQAVGSRDSLEQVEACLVAINPPLLYWVMEEGAEASWAGSKDLMGKGLILSKEAAAFAGWPCFEDGLFSQF